MDYEQTVEAMLVHLEENCSNEQGQAMLAALTRGIATVAAASHSIQDMELTLNTVMFNARRLAGEGYIRINGGVTTVDMLNAYNPERCDG